MQDWDPEKYLAFKAERTRPAAELMARIGNCAPQHITDLGCGPGNSTALLHQRWPEAKVTGIDSSPAMLEQARAALPECQFQSADIASWQPRVKQDVIYANASLQWLENHQQLLPHLTHQLADKGTLAVQIPNNWQEPTHRLMRQVAQELNHSVATRTAVLEAAAYYDLLSQQNCEVDLWHTTYFHVMASIQAIIDWLSTTGLRPFLADLNSSEQQKFLARYHQLLEQNYPKQHDGKVLMLFPRLFMIARKR